MPLVIIEIQINSVVKQDSRVGSKQRDKVQKISDNLIIVQTLVHYLSFRNSILPRRISSGPLE